MKKKLTNLLVMAILMSGMTALVACNENDEPAPIDDPTAIPLISEAPDQLSDAENLQYDTISKRWAGMMPPLMPYIHIYDEAVSTTEPTDSYDNEFYFEYKGKEYRSGDFFPESYREQPIGHIVKLMWSHDVKITPELILGSFYKLPDEYIIMRWPQKNLSVYITLVSQSKEITLYGWRDEPDGTKATVYTRGMYVNGKGTQALIIRITRSGEVKLNNHLWKIGM